MPEPGFERYYYPTHTFLLLSDYNELRSSLNLKPVDIAQGEYILHTKKVLLKFLDTFDKNNNISFNGNFLKCKAVYDEGISQNGHYGSGYILVVADSYKKDLIEKMQESKIATTKAQMKDKALEKVVEINKIEPPKVMVDDEIDNMIREMEMQLSQSGLNFDMYLSMLGRDINQLKGEMTEDAKKRVEMKMVVRAITEIEKIEATDEDIENEISALAKQYGLEVEKARDLLGEENREFLAKDVKMKKAIDLVFDNAVIK